MGRSLEPPLLIINMKNYGEVLGGRAMELARIAERLAERSRANLALAPPHPYLAKMAEEVKVPILAQHVDAVGLGSHTGYLVPEVLREVGVQGALINHSEHSLPQDTIKLTLERVRSVGLKSILCAKDVHEVSRLASMRPDFLAVEPPELIGSGIAVSKARPELITESLKAGRLAYPELVLLCGAGIVEPDDASTALRLGAQGILVASGIVKAREWGEAIRGMLRALEEATNT